MRISGLRTSCFHRDDYVCEWTSMPGEFWVARKSYWNFDQSARDMTRSKLPSFLLATWLLGTIATKSRMSDFLQSLQEYEIVYPRVIPNESARNRRSTHEDRETWREYLHQEPVFLEISNWTLRTMANDRLILSSNFTVNWVRQGKTKSERRNAKANCDLRQGSLEGDASSFVT